MKKVCFEVAFEIGDKVEFDNKVGKDEGTVIGYSVAPGSVTYRICWSNKEVSAHYGFELKLKEAYYGKEGPTR